MAQQPQLSKIVVRRLPPDLTFDSFKDIVGSLPKYNYIYFVKHDKSDQLNGFSRVYINFLSFRDLLEFKNRFDNYIFLGTKGAEFPAVIEFAPFQKVPRRRLEKQPARRASIEICDYYLNFLNDLKLSERLKCEKQVLDLPFPKKIDSENLTPLLKYISQRKLRIKDERRKLQKGENCLVFINSTAKKRSGYKRAF